MKLFHVNDKKTEKKFINVALNIYSNEKHWIRPLDKDINSVFNNKSSYLIIIEFDAVFQEL